MLDLSHSQICIVQIHFILLSVRSFILQRRNIWTNKLKKLNTVFQWLFVVSIAVATADATYNIHSFRYITAQANLFKVILVGACAFRSDNR